MNDLSLTIRTAEPRSGDPPYPGLLLLHGRGTDEGDLLPLASELDPRLFTVTARGPFDFPWGGYAWYQLDERGVGYPEADSLQVSLGALRELLDEIPRRFPVDPHRLFVGGFSMGGAMASALTLTDPDRVAGGIILSSYLPLDSGLEFRPEEAAGHPIFQAHGTADEVIPVRWGRGTRDFLAQMPVELMYREYPMGHQIGRAELRDLNAWLAGVLDPEIVDAPTGFSPA